jgi:hypothetical protein
MDKEERAVELSNMSRTTTDAQPSPLPDPPSSGSDDESYNAFFSPQAIAASLSNTPLPPGVTRIQTAETSDKPIYIGRAYHPIPSNRKHSKRAPSFFERCQIELRKPELNRHHLVISFAGILPYFYPILATEHALDVGLEATPLFMLVSMGVTALVAMLQTAVSDSIHSYVWSKAVAVHYDIPGTTRHHKPSPRCTPSISSTTPVIAGMLFSFMSSFLVAAGTKYFLEDLRVLVLLFNLLTAVLNACAQWWVHAASNRVRHCVVENDNDGYIAQRYGRSEREYLRMREKEKDDDDLELQPSACNREIVHCVNSDSFTEYAADALCGNRRYHRSSY